MRNRRVEAPFPVSPTEIRDQIVRRQEGGSLSGLDRRFRQRDRQVSLPHTRRAH